MRRRAVAKVFPAQDICLFCAFRNAFERRPLRKAFQTQTRLYRSTTPSLKPAGAAAVAEKDEDDEDYSVYRNNSEPLRHQDRPTRNDPAVSPWRKPSSYESMPDWGCGCGHINLPNRDSCSACREPRPQRPRLYSPPQILERPLFRDARPAPKQNQEYGDGQDRYRQPSNFASGDQLADALGNAFNGISRPSGRPTRKVASETLMDSIMPPILNGQQDRATVQDRAPQRSIRNSGSRFGEFMDTLAPSGPVQSSYPSRQTDSREGGSRFGSFMDNLGPPLRERLQQARPQSQSFTPPPRPGAARGVGVFGMDELERISGSKYSPQTGSDPRSDQFQAKGGRRQAGQPKEFRAGSSGVYGMEDFEKMGNSNSHFRRSQSRSRDDNSRPTQLQPRAGQLSSFQSNKTQTRAEQSGGIDSFDGFGPEEIQAPVSSSPFSNFTTHHRKGLAQPDKVDRRSQRFATTDEEPVNVEIRKDQKKKGRGDRGVSSQAADYEAEDEVEALLDGTAKRKSKRNKTKQKTVPTKSQIQLPDFISVEKLSQALKVRLDSFVQKLEEEGFEGARYDHILDAESSAMIADLYGFEPIFGSESATQDLVAQPAADDKSLLPPRPPIVTIMGHVDHGKTTILDWLRKSSVVESEHGGITQHIGAFSFTMPGSNRQITFLDTPGHAAFLDMRRRGANVTDIVVLVVAADDSVKPQTIEAIKHALEAKVQIIVAINKVDKQDADPERVKQDLAKHEITVEDYGGDYQAIPVSGKTGQGMANLEEAIITLADVSDFRAEVDGPAEGWVIESKVTIAGRVATILVRRGRLRPGDIIVAGTTWSRVRTLRNDAGALVEEAPPGTPVQVDGWRGDPTAGLEVLQAESEDHAKDVVDLRVEREEVARTTTDMAAINIARSEGAEERAKVLEMEAEQKRNFAATTTKRRYVKPKDNEGWVEAADSDGPQQVHFVVRADVTGSVEALVAAVSAIGNNEITANVIHSGPGLVNESDIRLLATTGDTGYAISFNQTIDGSISRLAEAAGIQILDHNIIYKVTDDVKAKLSDALPPLITQKVLGEAEIGQIFDISTKKGKLKIAGCKITNGTVDRSHKIRVLRKKETVYTGTLDSLKNVKKDVSEMRKGNECGMGFQNWTDFEVGDQIQCFEEKEEQRVIY